MTYTYKIKISITNVYIQEFLNEKYCNWNWNIDELFNEDYILLGEEYRSKKRTENFLKINHPEFLL